MQESQPSPPWGRGCPPTGIFISRGRTGEGVKTVKTPYPSPKTRSLASTVGQKIKATSCCGSPRV